MPGFQFFRWLASFLGTHFCKAPKLMHRMFERCVKLIRWTCLCQWLLKIGYPKCSIYKASEKRPFAKLQQGRSSLTMTTRS